MHIEGVISVCHLVDDRLYAGLTESYSIMIRLWYIILSVYGDKFKWFLEHFHRSSKQQHNNNSALVCSPPIVSKDSTSPGSFFVCDQTQLFSSHISSQSTLYFSISIAFSTCNGANPDLPSPGTPPNTCKSGTDRYAQQCNSMQSLISSSIIPKLSQDFGPSVVIQRAATITGRIFRPFQQLGLIQ